MRLEEWGLPGGACNARWPYSTATSDPYALAHHQLNRIHQYAATDLGILDLASSLQVIPGDLASYNPDKWGAVHICDLYSITKNQDAIRRLFYIVRTAIRK